MVAKEKTTAAVLSQQLAVVVGMGKPGPYVYVMHSLNDPDNNFSPARIRIIEIFSCFFSGVFMSLMHQ